MTSSQVTASSSLEALAAAAGRRRPRRPAHPEPPRPAAALQTRAESTPEIPARHRHQDNRHRETPGQRIRARILLARRQDRKPSGRRNRPARAGPRTVEPRATPAATRGSQPSPHRAATTTKPDFKTGTEHQNRNTPERHKHLKSLVLGAGAARPTNVAAATAATRGQTRPARRGLRPSVLSAVGRDQPAGTRVSLRGPVPASSMVPRAISLCC